MGERDKKVETEVSELLAENAKLQRLIEDLNEGMSHLEGQLFESRRQVEFLSNRLLAERD